MLTLENYYANGCKRKRWRSVKLSKRYLRAPDDRKKKVTLWTKFFGESRSCKLATSFWNSLSKSRLIYLSRLYHLTYQFATSIDGNYLQPITYHTASCSNKRVFFLLLFSLLEILHLGWEASVVNSWKKMRDYKVMILIRKPVVSRRRNLVWRWDWKKKRAYLFAWSDLQITFWRRFSSISWSRKIIDGCLTIVCFFEN